MKILLYFFSVLISIVCIYGSYALSSCQKIKFADIGWTDISVSNALAMRIFNLANYETKSIHVSIPMTYVGLKNNDIDIFLGTWLPSMKSDISVYLERGQIENLGKLLSNAHFSVAVPEYVYNLGVKSIQDLSNYKNKFLGKIYGIEPGNDGNRLLQSMIASPEMKLNGFRLIESSEQAMFLEVLQSVKKNKWIVFLAWHPHPINSKIKIKYLDGAENFFGKNYGASEVHIYSRKKYALECPKEAEFFKKFKLEINDFEMMMGWIMQQKMDPKQAADKWIDLNNDKVQNWIKELKENSSV